MGFDLRRWFGRYDIDDPRPIAARAPYTFELPSSEELGEIGTGDLVQLIFRSQPPGERWDAERMWVAITKADSGVLEGELQNQPSDMPQLKLNQTVRFASHCIIAVKFQDETKSVRFAKPRSRTWDRCLVDDCVLDGSASVHFVYREDPDMTADEDEYPDSGWRIRGDYRECSDAEVDDRSASYVALGAVLNRDDSWVHLIDAPIGSRFIRNFETGEFEPENESA